MEDEENVLDDFELFDSETIALEYDEELYYTNPSDPSNTGTGEKHFFNNDLSMNVNQTIINDEQLLFEGRQTFVGYFIWHSHNHALIYIHIIT